MEQPLEIKDGSTRLFLGLLDVDNEIEVSIEDDYNNGIIYLSLDKIKELHSYLGKILI